MIQLDFRNYVTLIVIVGLTAGLVGLPTIYESFQPPAIIQIHEANGEVTIQYAERIPLNDNPVYLIFVGAILANGFSAVMIFLYKAKKGTGNDD